MNIIGSLSKGRLLEFDHNFPVKLTNTTMKGKAKEKKVKILS